VLTPNHPIPGRNLAATLRPKKYTSHQPAFFLFGKKSPSDHTDQISGDIPRFSLKEFIKLRPWSGGRWGGVVWRIATSLTTLKQEKTLPRQPAFLFFWAKNGHCLKKVLAKFPLFLK
jgi:hypothetical protein